MTKYKNSVFALIRLILIILISIFFISCWQPTFNIEISTAALVSKKLDFSGEIGPIELDYWSLNNKFIPALEKNPEEGFLIGSNVENYELRILYIYKDSFGDDFKSFNISLYSVNAFKGTSSAGPVIEKNFYGATTTIKYKEPVLFIVHGDDTSSKLVSIQINKSYSSELVSELSTPIITYNTPWEEPYSVSITSPMGFSSWMFINDQTNISFCILTPYDGYYSQIYGTGFFSNNSIEPFYLDSTWFFQMTNIYSNQQINSSGYCGLRYSTDSSKTFVVTSSTEGSFKNPTVGYDSIQPENLVAISVEKPVKAVLTSGDMISMDKEMLYVFDSNGNKKFDTNIGKLRYVHEVWDKNDSRWHMIFVLPLVQEIRDSDKYRMIYQIYSLPTNEISNLE